MKLNKVLLFLCIVIGFESAQTAYAAPRSLTISGGRARNIYGVSNSSNIYGVRRGGNIYGVRRFGNRAFGVRGNSFARSGIASGVNGGYAPGNYESAAAADEQGSYEYHPMSEAERQRDVATYEYDRRFNE